MRFYKLRWFRLEKSLKSLQTEGTSFTFLEDVRKEAQEVCNTEEENDFRTIINYFHDRHVVLHFDDTSELDKIVVLDNQWLIDVFKMVITVRPLQDQVKGFEEHWTALEREGVLRYELVQHVWKHLTKNKAAIDGLLSLLEKFSLACRWTQPDDSEVCNGAFFLLYNFVGFIFMGNLLCSKNTNIVTFLIT